jgi:hypothetical protein
MFRNFAARFVNLPDPVKAGITAVILYAVSFLFANLIVLVPFLAFLSAFVQPIAISVSIALIAWIQNAIPDAFGAVAIKAAELILALLAVYGVGVELAARGALPALLSP